MEVRTIEEIKERYKDFLGDEVKRRAERYTISSVQSEESQLLAKALERASKNAPFLEKYLKLKKPLNN